MTEATKQKLQNLAKSAATRAGWIAALLVAFVIGLFLAAGDPPPKKHKPGGNAMAKTGEHSGHDHKAGGDSKAGDEKPTEYTCSMHPQVRSPEPGKCPICGMDLVPVQQVKASKAHGLDPNKVITLTPRARILARIRTFKVRSHETVAGERRLLGRIDYDETRIKTVTAWTAGRIDRLLVATTGQRVRRYQAIAYIYSPEIYAAQSDLIQAAKQIKRLAGATPLAQSAAKAALRSARQRLRLLGVPGGVIKRMERARQPQRHVAIHTPFGGTVLKRLVDEGNYVQAGTGLYRISDLSRLWVQLDAYESDLPYLKKGQTVDLSVEALPGKKLVGKVTFIDPVVDAKTRTVRVRVEVKNDGALRPGMFAEAAVQGSKHPGKHRHVPLVIPATAPLFTGQRSVVYVEVDNSDGLSYEARTVTLGPKAGNVYPVVSGLKAGERVVVHGAFALDADLQLRGGHSMMTLQDDASRRKSGPLADVPAAVMRPLAGVVKAYLDGHDGLQADSLARTTRAAKALDAAVDNVSAVMPERLSWAWKPSSKTLHALARRMAASKDLASARSYLPALTAELKLVLQRFGNPLPEQINLAFCPMALGEGRGAEWLQRGIKLRNPYLGKKMHSCGEIRAHVAPTGHLKPKPAAPKTTTGGGHHH